MESIKNIQHGHVLKLWTELVWMGWVEFVKSTGVLKIRSFCSVPHKSLVDGEQNKQFVSKLCVVENLVKQFFFDVYDVVYQRIHAHT